MENPDHYKTIHKLSVRAAMFLLYFYLFSSIVLVIKYGIKDFSIALSDDFVPYLSVIVSNIVVAFICSFLLFLLVRQNNKKKSEIKEILIFFFVFSAFPAYIIGFHYLIPANDLILKAYNLISPQFLIPGATFFLALFVLEIFDKGLDRKKNQIKMHFISIATIIACLLNFQYMLVSIDPEGNTSAAANINLFYYIIILPLYTYYYLSLMFRSYMLVQRIDEPHYKKGVQYLGISGAMLGIIYFGRIILFATSPDPSNFWDIVYAILDYISLVGYVLLYLGIVNPSKHKENIGTKGQPSKMMEMIIEKQGKDQAKKLKSGNIENIPLIRKTFEKTGKMMLFSKKVKKVELSVGSIEAELLSPLGSNSEDIILYFHGGGYVYCSINTHRGLASLIAEQTQIPVLIVNYRRAPEDPYPSALVDAVYTYNWLIEEKHYSPDKIIIGGDSAGGGLAMATMLKLKDENRVLPKAAFLISPWVDLALKGNSFGTKTEKDVVLTPEELRFWVKSYIGDEDPKNPYISPLYGNLEDLPPIFIQVGTSELLYDDSKRLMQKLIRSKKFRNVKRVAQHASCFSALCCD